MINPVPRTANGRATRERIIRAASDLVADRGVAATSLEDVCTGARASKSQLYLYFNDRDALLSEVANQTCDTVIERQTEVLAGFDSIAGIRRYLDAYVEAQSRRKTQPGCPIATLAGQIANQNEQARLNLADGLQRWENGLLAGLTTMAARGDLRDDADPALLATQTLALMQGGLLLTQVRRDAGQMRKAADAVLALICAAVTVPPSESG